MSGEKEKMQQTIQAIDEVVDLFYQQRLKQALDQLDGVIQDIMGTVDGLFQYREAHQEFALDEKRLTGTLTEAMQALEDQDLVMLADVLQYEFKEYLEELEGQME